MLPGTIVSTTTVLNPIHCGFVDGGYTLAAPDLPNLNASSVGPTQELCMRACADLSTCAAFEYQAWANGSVTCSLKETTAFHYSPYVGNGVVGIAPAYVPYPLSVADMQAMCEATPGCATFSTLDGLLRAFAQDTNYNSWISNASCGKAAKTALVRRGTCLYLDNTWITCTGMLATGVYTLSTWMAQPPEYLAAYCDQLDAACVGFVAAADNSNGYLLHWAPSYVLGEVGVLLRSV